MNITVYCSARNAVAESYKQAAYALGEWIALQGHRLVYGGATGGLMSAVAEGAHAHQGIITGIIPNRIMRANRLSPLLTEKEEVATMSERKQRMKDLADCFVILPGGYGTLDEMFDVIASGTVGEHHKPLILFNPEGIYDALLQEIDEMKKNELIPAEESYTFSTCNTLDDLLSHLSTINSKITHQH